MVLPYWFFPITGVCLAANPRGYTVHRTHMLGPNTKSRWEVVDGKRVIRGTFIRRYLLAPLEFYADTVFSKTDPLVEELGRRYAKVILEPFRP